MALGLVALAPALAAGASVAHGVATGRPVSPRSALVRPGKANPARRTTTSSVSGPIVPIDTHPSASQLANGKTLFDDNCSTCHGSEGQGSDRAPNLRGLGPGIPYLWVSSGWMPLANPTAEPITKPPLFSRSQIVDIAEYVGSFEPGGQPIWAVNLSHTSESAGLSLFALNCAPCHTITGAGDAISDGQFAPSLHGVTATQIAEAMRQGPGNMPPFAVTQISNAQLANLADYVTRVIQHPQNPGGVGLGGVGPVAEGFIGLFLGVGGCIVAALWIGERAEAKKDGSSAGEHAKGSGHGAPGAADSGVVHV